LAKIRTNLVALKSQFIGVIFVADSHSVTHSQPRCPKATRNVCQACRP